MTSAWAAPRLGPTHASPSRDASQARPSRYALQLNIGEQLSRANGPPGPWGAEGPRRHASTPEQFLSFGQDVGFEQSLVQHSLELCSRGDSACTGAWTCARRAWQGARGGQSWEQSHGAQLGAKSPRQPGDPQQDRKSASASCCLNSPGSVPLSGPDSAHQYFKNKHT